MVPVPISAPVWPALSFAGRIGCCAPASWSSSPSGKLFAPLSGSGAFFAPIPL